MAAAGQANVLLLLAVVSCSTGALITSGDKGYRPGNCSENANLTCDSGADCVDSADSLSFTCKCQDNAEGDGFKVESQGTGCQQASRPCSSDIECHHNGFCDLDEYKCACQAGFEGNGYNCSDINECPSPKCHKHADCINYPGGFNCTCDANKNYVGDGYTCVFFCHNNNDCDTPRAKCNANNTCECSVGYEGNGVTCADIDECANASISNCSIEAECTNTNGSYKCQCKNGFTGNGHTCTKMPQNCDEIADFKPGGSYNIDADGNGPANAMKVVCNRIGDNVVTEVPPTRGFPVAAPENNVPLNITYTAGLTEIVALLERSVYCFQEITFSCYTGVALFPGTVWTGRRQQPNENWGSTIWRKCACGEVNVCPSGCYCDGTQTARLTPELGRIMDMSDLPLLSINFNQKNKGKGRLDIGPLICANNSIDIPRDCDDAKIKFKVKENVPMYIDADGPGGNPPFLVFCNMTSYSHVGITVIPVKRSVLVPSTAAGEPVEYTVGLPSVLALIRRSAFCSQYMEYWGKNSNPIDGGGYVTVGQSNRRLGYFAGGLGEQNSCACGTTQSCEDPRLKCNCGIEDGRQRKDFGYIFNTSDLPVTGVFAKIGDNSSGVYIVKNIQCSQKMFGIEPNCEKYRATGMGDNYTFTVDSDGTGESPPYNVDCRFKQHPPQGETIIHHKNENPQVVRSETLTIEYLQVSAHQISALKRRSTICTQYIGIDCKYFRIPTSRDTISWTDARDRQFRLSKYLDSCSSTNTTCNCQLDVKQSSNSGLIKDIEKLPITSINFSAVKDQLTGHGELVVTVGPLICTEVFHSCASMKKHLNSKSVEGEAAVQDGSFTIDPDGGEGEQAFQVNCLFPTTIVNIDNPVGGLTSDPDNHGPTSACFDINYTNYNDEILSPAQIRVLVKKSRRCRQDLEIKGLNVLASKWVNYTTCDGKLWKGWIGGNGEEKCACGINGNCAGGRYAACNCDMTDDELRSDSGSLIRDAMPVCKICIRVDPSAEGSPSRSELTFKVGNLFCDTDLGVKKTCQDARRSAAGSIKTVQEIPVMINKYTSLAGCRFEPNPPIGVLVLKVANPINPPSTEVTTNIQVEYINKNYKQVVAMFKDYEYCIQNVFFFGAASKTQDVHRDVKFYDTDGQMLTNFREINETSKYIQKAKKDYQNLVKEHGLPTGFTLFNKNELPALRVYLPPGLSYVVVVGDLECFDLKRTCQEILDVYNRAIGLVNGEKYVIDPDGHDETDPILVRCDMNFKNKHGVTEIMPEGQWVRPVTVIGKPKQNAVTLSVAYNQVSYKAISALTKASHFCWQGIQWFCQLCTIGNETDSSSSFYSLYGHNRSLSFGTGADLYYPGCACGLTGTCETNSTCNSNNVAQMTLDQGVVTAKDVLPITDVTVKLAAYRSMVKILLTGIRCSRWSFDFPRNCDEVLKRGKQFGYISIISGVYAISPKPKILDIVFVYCDFDMVSKSAVTIIKVVGPSRRQLNKTLEATSTVRYHIPSDKHLSAIVQQSGYCYQCVLFECEGSTLLKDGSYWKNLEPRSKYTFWGGGHAGDGGDRGFCACGKGKSCGGLDSAREQRARRCNCDVGDDTPRADAGIFNSTKYIPITKFVIGAKAQFNKAYLTVGDIYCSQKPLSLNPCEHGCHDCHTKARCIPQGISYECVCFEGWNGKGVVVNSKQARANGRECIDDNECAGSNPCPHTATCENTLGSFVCVCNSGYVQTGPTSCQDINECSNSSLNDCSDNARCENLDGSFRCICNRGFRGDGRTCFPVGECMCFGDTHCLTYDLVWLHVQGEKGYILSEDGCQPGQPQTYRVLMYTSKKSSTRPGCYSHIQHLVVTTFNKVILMGQGGHVIVDGLAVRSYQNSYVKITIVQHKVELSTFTGLEVKWDGQDTVKVVTSKNSKNSSCGLCSNYNENPADDMIVGPACPSNAGNLTDNEAEFVDSWSVPNSTEHVNCSHNQARQVDDQCFYLRSIVHYECSLLLDIKTSPFKKCLKIMKTSDLDEFRARCEYDGCHVQENLDKELCRFAEIIAWHCLENEKYDVSDWASQLRVCAERPKCPNNMVPKTSKNLSMLTCQGDELNSETDRSQECFCEHGQVLDGDRCINSKGCGCIYQNGYLATGDIITSANCSQIECQGMNVTKETTVKFEENEECSEVDRVFSKACKKGFIRSDNNQCIRDRCYGVRCTIPNMACVDGACACKPGFTRDCEQCNDIDECATGAATMCGRIGHACINTPGSFTCVCEKGYSGDGQHCHDINECEYPIHSCGRNSECVNTPGSFHCECCAGYIKNKNSTCQRDKAEQPPGKKCCACHDKKCEEPGTVCGTNGKTYPSYRSLFIAACQAGKDNLTVNYKGTCKDKCSKVACGKQYASCEEVKNVPQCGCPKCENYTSSSQSEMVCATNKITYYNRCHMEAETCKSETETTISIETIGKPCPPEDDEKEEPWSSWSPCSEKCKQGVQTRFRKISNNSTGQSEEESQSVPCYNTCAEGPCQDNSCKGPGEVCVVDNNNMQSCRCPSCAATFSNDLICGRLGNSIKTFQNECELQMMACKKKEPIFEVLERRACETKPVDCDLVRNFNEYTDENGCTAGSINLVKCEGGCHNVGGLCCFGTEYKNETVALICPDGSKTEKKLTTITKCNCITVADVEALEKKIVNP